MIKKLRSRYTIKENIYRAILTVLLLPLLGIGVWCSYNVHILSKQRDNIKNDYADVNDIKYGLLSVDAWRDNIESIITSQIHDFHLTRGQEDTLRVQLDNIFNQFITQADSMINQKQTSIGGKLKKFAVKTFVNIDKIRAKVPQFSQTVLNEVESPSNKQKLQGIVMDKLHDFAQQTYDSTSDQALLDNILTKYGVTSVDDFNNKTRQQIVQLQQETYNFTFAMLALPVLFLLIWWLVRKKRALYVPLFIISVLLALLLLFTGITSPMIEIDARIKELNFVVLGKSIVFQNQVLFYQSKSILDVVHILLTTGKADSILVGALILIFSIIFPISKLVSTELFLLGHEKFKNNAVIKFFAFKSGKWSMADVAVVAIFMAYVGFKGILDSQLSNLDIKTSSLQSIATNKTSLQPGFLLFIAFVFFGLVLSEILKRITTKYAISGKTIGEYKA
jgi:hypothetical protein